MQFQGRRRGGVLVGQLDLLDAIAMRLDLIDRVPDASSVNQQDRHSVDANRLRQSVASGTWNLGYDSPAASQQPIEQTRLTDIWPTDERCLEPVA